METAMLTVEYLTVIAHVSETEDVDKMIIQGGWRVTCKGFQQLPDSDRAIFDSQKIVVHARRER